MTAKERAEELTETTYGEYTMDKETIRKAEDRALDVTAKQGWPNWVKHLIWYIVGGISAVLCMTQTGCTYTSSQVAADGSTANRVFAVDAATARDLVKLYGIPEIPTVKPTK